MNGFNSTSDFPLTLLLHVSQSRPAMSNIEMQYRPLPSSDNSPIPEHHHSSSSNYSKRPAVRWGALVLATLATTVVSYNVATTRSFSSTAAGPLTLLDVNPAAAPVRQLFLNAKKNPLSATKDFKTGEYAS